jgi:hypothetical protein
MTRVVQIAKMPVEEQDRELKVRGLPKADELAFFDRTYIFPRVAKITTDLSEGQISGQAELRCAIVAIVAKRYASMHRSWPSSLDDLVPAFLPAVPRDPFDGAQLRFRVLDDGIIIYCLGPDNVDDGGKIDWQKPGRPGTDLGLRLWTKR